MEASKDATEFRRKWDKEEYEKIARDRIDAEQDAAKEKEARKQRREPPPRREMLKPRDYKVDLESKVGKSVVITKTTSNADAGGYYCNVCDCIVKDSINFLDHINGKKHQRNLGMSMKLRRATLDDVKERFELKKRQAEEKQKEYDWKERMQELQDEESRLAEYRRQKRQEQKKRKRGEVEDDDEQPSEGVDAEVAAMMGFSGFNSSKKK